MGLFSSEKVVYVSSVVYNMAGEPKDRPNYLKSLMTGRVINGSKGSAADVIRQGYLSGPGVHFRQFGDWVRSSNYHKVVGVPRGSFNMNQSLDKLKVAAAIPKQPGEVIQIRSAAIGKADYRYWVDRWILENHPELAANSAKYEVQFLEDGKVVNIYVAAGIGQESGPVYQFTIPDYDTNARYLYISYTISAPQEIEAATGGGTITIAESASFPPTLGWSTKSDTTTSTTYNIGTTTRETVTYSDGRPSTDNTTTPYVPGTWTHGVRVREKVAYATAPDKGDSLALITDRQVETTGIKIVEETTSDYLVRYEGNLTITTNIVRTTRKGVVTKSYTKTNQRTIIKRWSNLQMLMYKENSGLPELDILFDVPEELGDFLPPIPYRLDNKFVGPDYLSDLYKASKKALKKSIKGDYDEVMDKIADNESIAEIDYAYTIFAVPLNTKSDEARLYLYQFFKMLADRYLSQTDSDYFLWESQWTMADTSLQAWAAWRAGQVEGNPLWNTPEPAIMGYPVKPAYQLRIATSERPEVNFDMTIALSSITHEYKTGLGQPGAKAGATWIKLIRKDGDLTEAVYNDRVMLLGLSHTRSLIEIGLQIDADNWSCLRVRDLAHLNTIYGGKSVEINGPDALADADESGFLIPIHEESFKNMGMVKSTQLATQSAFLVFNCYTVVKKKWYQSSLFKVFLVIVIVVISVYTGGAAAAGSGLLGGNVAVGTALGFSAATAAIVGAVANAVAAMVLSQIIMTVSTKFFGEKFGAIIGAIASFIAINVGTSLMNGGSITAGFSNMLRVDNLMKLMSSVGNGISGYMAGATQEIMDQSQSMLSKYEEDLKKIQDAYSTNISDGNTGTINPLALTDVFGSVQESRDTFLARTLMTGSDIATLTNEMLSNFVSMTVNTDLT